MKRPSAAEVRELLTLWAPRVLVAFATVWLTFAAAYDNLGIRDIGHMGGALGANYMASEAMAKGLAWYPSLDFLGDRVPPPATAYCHHPWGTYFIAALDMKLFGARDWAMSLPAILMSAATPYLIYAALRRALGRFPAAIGALVFTMVPLEVGYSGFHNLEVGPMFGFMLFAAMAVRWFETGQKRFFWASLAGALLGMCHGWVGYLFMILPLGCGFLAEFTFKRLRSRPTVHDRAVRLWAWCVLLAVLSAMFWVGAYQRLGHLGEWMRQFEQRSSGGARGLEATLTIRKDWIDFCFPPVFRVITAIALPLFVIRPLVRRRLPEILGLASLFGALAWYLGFTQAADMHVFWPQPLALPIGIAAAVVVATANDVVRWLGRRLSFPQVARGIAWVGATCATLLAFAFFPDACRALQIWKETGGRYDERGDYVVFNTTDADFVLIERAREQRKRVNVMIHNSFGVEAWWDLSWALRKNPEKWNAPIERGSSNQLLFARASGLSHSELETLADTGAISQYGDVLLSDSRSDAAPVAYRIERAPTLWESFVHGSFANSYEIPAAPDPFATWELGVHVGRPTPPPGAPPADLEQRRIAYNMTVEAGQPDQAQLQGLLSQLDTGVSAKAGPVELLGIRREAGPAHRLELWLRTSEALPQSPVLRVWAECTAPLPFSFVPAATRVLQGHAPLTFSPAALRPGYVYIAKYTPNHRICVEKLRGQVLSGAKAGASRVLELQTLR